MALADIIGRIESDAGAEARTLKDGAKAKAEEIVSDATRKGEKEKQELLAHSKHEAESRAATLLANARLSARDDMLAAKRALVMRVLAEAEEQLLALDDGAYTRLIAAGIMRTAHDGDTVSISGADKGRLGGLEAAVKALAAGSKRPITLDFAGKSTEIAHGVMLSGDRVSAEVSPASMVVGQREHLMAIAAGKLFPAEEG